jgi:hypothetical protein
MFETKLKEHKAIFEIEGYKKKAMSEVLNYLKEAKKRVDNATVYNAELTSEIMTKENLAEDYRDYVNTEVYFAQHDFRQEEEEEYKAKMTAEGWLPLTENTDYEGKCEYIATRTLDWCTSKLKNTGKLQKLESGLFLTPKGKRTRGYYIKNLDNAFYKPLTK